MTAYMNSPVVFGNLTAETNAIKGQSVHLLSCKINTLASVELGLRKLFEIVYNSVLIKTKCKSVSDSFLECSWCCILLKNIDFVSNIKL